MVKQPVLEVIRTQPRAILTSAFVRMAEQAPFYLFITFVLAYGTKHLELQPQRPAQRHADRRRDRLHHRAAVRATCPTCSAGGWSTASASCRRRVRLPLLRAAQHQGERPGAAGDRASRWSLHDIMYGPQAALISETFGTGVRYSGAGLGYQLASVIAGGPAPLIATAILARTGVLDLDLAVHHRLRGRLDDRAAAHAEAARQRRGRRRRRRGDALAAALGAGEPARPRPVRPAALDEEDRDLAGRSSSGSRRSRGRRPRPAPTTAPSPRR